jgi:hypothetical protein
MDLITTVSIRASRQYIKAISALARQRDQRIGDLIREAVDAQHGEALRRYVEFFDANVGVSKHNLEKENAG